MELEGLPNASLQILGQSFTKSLFKLHCLHQVTEVLAAVQHHVRKRWIDIGPERALHAGFWLKQTYLELVKELQ